MSQCRVDTFRGSGPGGQKRNKTSNAVRIVHASGVMGTASEDRSLLVNKTHALARLKVKLACELREPVDLPQFAPPGWLDEVKRGRSLAVSVKNPLYIPVVGLVLDLFHVTGASPAAVGANLGVSTSAVLKVLESDSVVWMTANRMRADAGLPPLSARR